MNKNFFGKRIRQYREAAGLTQEKLAAYIDVSPIFISYIERGIRLPSLNNFIKIANTLNISADILLADSLSSGYKIRASQFADKLDELPKREQQRIFAVLDAMIEQK